MAERRLHRIERYLADGRRQWLYHDVPVSPATVPPVERRDPGGVHERRWHALRAEWVTYATARQDRTFLPPADQCPLCPPKPGQPPTEVPAAPWQLAVFENRFPSYESPAPPVRDRPEPWRTASTEGACEVVVYTQDHDARLADATAEHIGRLIEVWTDRTRELEARPEVECVFVFENRGEAIGVTLHHPHGQIYAYPFVPPVLRDELGAFAAHSGCLLCETADAEVRDGDRVVLDEPGWAAYVPFAARWPYEVHVVPRRHLGTLAELTDAERDALARLLRRLLRGYDALWDRPLPYVMALHARPAAEPDAPYHLHLEFYPPNRTATKLKYLAGSEGGAGAFINDTVPEETAASLREAIGRGADA